MFAKIIPDPFRHNKKRAGKDASSPLLTDVMIKDYGRFSSVSLISGQMLAFSWPRLQEATPAKS